MSKAKTITLADNPKPKPSIVESDDEDDVSVDQSSDDDVTDDENDDPTVLLSPPPAPPLKSTGIPVVTARVVGVHPPPERAYILGDDVVICLGKLSGKRMLQLRECTQKGQKFHVHDYKKARLDAMQVKNLQYRLHNGIRDTMHDGGPKNKQGVESYAVSKLLQVEINLEYGLKLDIREMFIPQGEPDPVCTRRGVRLNTDQVDELTRVLDLIKPHWASFDELDVPCFVRHLQFENQEDLMNCPYCN